jgi:hypothetical protein
MAVHQQIKRSGRFQGEQPRESMANLLVMQKIVMHKSIIGKVAAHIDKTF